MDPAVSWAEKSLPPSTCGELRPQRHVAPARGKVSSLAALREQTVLQVQAYWNHRQCGAISHACGCNEASIARNHGAALALILPYPRERINSAPNLAGSRPPRLVRGSTGTQSEDGVQPSRTAQAHDNGQQ